MKFKVASRTEECKNCGFCDLICTHQDNCTGRGECVVACPYEAKILEEISEPRKELKPSCVTSVEEGMAIITDREERAQEDSFQFSRACCRWCRHAVLAKAKGHLLWIYNEWKAIKYLIENADKMFVGIGIPYNEALISLDEVYQIGERIAGWSSDVQVCAIDYRPVFRRMELRKPNYVDMQRVKGVLDDSGLRCVICQTEFGIIGP